MSDVMRGHRWFFVVILGLLGLLVSIHVMYYADAPADVLRCPRCFARVHPFATKCRECYADFERPTTLREAQAR